VIATPQLNIVVAGADAGELPYRIELQEDGQGRVLALCGSPSLAYAAYYAAMREHFGRQLSLKRGIQVLASSSLRG